MTKDARDHHVTKPRLDRGVDDQQISPVQAQAMGFIAAQAHLSDVVRVWLKQLVKVSRHTVILYSYMQLDVFCALEDANRCRRLPD